MGDEDFNQIDEDLYNELQEEYDKANYEALKKQNAKLLQQIRGGSPSILEQYRKNNKSRVNALILSKRDDSVPFLFFHYFILLSSKRDTDKQV